LHQHQHQHQHQDKREQALRQHEQQQGGEAWKWPRYADPTLPSSHLQVGTQSLPLYSSISSASKWRNCDACTTLRHTIRRTSKCTAKAS
jgi:hypothetical protein